MGVIKMADSKIKLDETVDNSERKFGEALKYFPVKIIDTDDNVEWGMFTENEIQIAIERAKKNKEDIPKSLWESIFG